MAALVASGRWPKQTATFSFGSAANHPFEALQLGRYDYVPVGVATWTYRDQTSTVAGSIREPAASHSRSRSSVICTSLCICTSLSVPRKNRGRLRSAAIGHDLV
jgi:hypothetical protein